MSASANGETKWIGSGELRASSTLVRTTIRMVSGREVDIVAHDIGGELIVEGDIVVRRIPLAPLPAPEGSVVHDPNRRWPGGIVPFMVDASIFFFQDAIHEAIAMWQQRTAVLFRKATAQDANYAVFRRGPGDSSQVGMVGGQQFVDIESGAGSGTVAHEIGHLIGLWHEHSRHDRDAHIEIVWNNISSDAQNNFNQPLHEPADDLGPYDYDSIMHYPSVAFPVTDHLVTIITSNGQPIGQRTHISDGDAQAVTTLYQGA